MAEWSKARRKKFSATMAHKRELKEKERKEADVQTFPLALLPDRAPPRPRKPRTIDAIPVAKSKGVAITMNVHGIIITIGTL